MKNNNKVINLNEVRLLKILKEHDFENNSLREKFRMITGRFIAEKLFPKKKPLVLLIFMLFFYGIVFGYRRKYK
jgi:hypothetical protein